MLPIYIWLAPLKRKEYLFSCTPSASSHDTTEQVSVTTDMTLFMSETAQRWAAKQLADIQQLYSQAEAA